MIDAWCDRWHRRARRLLHPFDFQRRWFRELSGFYRHLSEPEFWHRYIHERALAQGLWERRQSFPDINVWAATDYYVLRQQYVHRDSCYHAVAAKLPRFGWLLEFGCGVAPVSAWMARHRPDVKLHLADVPSRTRDFAHWRLPGATVTTPDLAGFANHFDVIVCWEVLEHVPDPAETMRALVASLRRGGHLFIDYVAEQGDGGRGIEERDRAMGVLGALTPLRRLTAQGGKGVYRR